MKLRYDFDIFDVSPPEEGGDPELMGFFVRAGLGGGAGTSQVALFRDEETARALREAPRAMRAYFLESGFGLNTYRSGAPVDHYPATDEAARLRVIERLTANAGLFALPGAEQTPPDGFSLSDFIAHLAIAAPIDMPAPAQASTPTFDAISAPLPKNRGEAPTARASAALNQIAGVTGRLLRQMPRLGQLRRP